MKSDKQISIEDDFSFKNYFIPLTVSKAITWLIVIGFVVYGNILLNGFVGDDKIYIINFFPSHFISLPNAFGSNVYNTDGQYRPLAVVYFSVLYAFFGSNAFTYHLIQLVLHIVCTILIFFIFRKFFSIYPSFFSALLFLIHPLQVESVAYIAQTDNELYFIFGIMAFLFSIKNKISLRRNLLISFLLLSSVLTKETGLLFIILIIIYKFLFTRKQSVTFIISGIIIIAIYLYVRIFIGHVGFDTRQLSPIATAPLAVRLLTLPAILFYYIKSFLFPISLAYDQQWIISAITVSNFYIPLFMDITFFTSIIIAGLLILRKKSKYTKLFIFFLCWLLLGIGIVSQIYPLDATVADRWFYFPFVGLLGLIVLSLHLFPSDNTVMRKTSIILFTIILLGLSFRTIIRNSNYSDSITLFSHDSKISDNSNIDENLAYELLLANNFKDGLFYLQKSVNEAPNASSLYDLGNLYEQSQDFTKAMYYYNASIQHVGKIYGEDQVIKNDYDGIAKILTFHDNQKIAKKFLENVIKMYPKDGSYWAFLAIVDYSNNDRKDALSAALEAEKLLHNRTASLLYDKIMHNQPLNFKN